MIYTTENQLLKDIKANSFHNLYLFYGDETFLIDKYTEKIAETLVRDNENFNITNFDGQETTVKDISETIDKYPFFADKRVVIISNPAQNEIISSADMKKVLSDIPDFSVVIIKIKNTEFNPRRNKSQGDFLKLCDKYGAVLMFGEKTETDLIKFIIKMAKREDCTIEKQEAQLLCDRCGGNMQKITTELAKLTAYAEKSAITEEMIENITIPTVEAQIYDLSKTMHRGNLEKSLEILEKLFIMKEEPIIIMATLSYYYSDLYKAKLSKEKHISPADSGEFFGYKPGDFRIRNAFTDCSRYSYEYLIRIIKILADADLSLKSSVLNPNLVLEKAIIEIFNARKD